jgi:hypothetical protein
VTPSIDTSAFQLGVAPGEDEQEEAPLLDGLAAEARAFIESHASAPLIKDLLLAYGVGGIIGLFLVRFTRPLSGELQGETEMWAVVGDLPSACFETDSAPTPPLALKLYCAICQDWAEAVLEGRDLSDSYPIRAAPTREHAEMLMGRIEFVREKLIPLAKARSRTN